MTANLESSVILKPPPPWWRRWLKRLGKAVLLLAIAIGCRQAWHHHQVSKRLAETLAEIDRAEPGWRLEDIEAAREQISEEENSARVVVTAAQLLPKNWPPQEFADLFAHREPVKQLPPEDFARLTKELENVRPALEEARKLAAMPCGRHRIVYQRNTLETRLNEQGESRRIASLLVSDVLWHGQIGDGKSAVTSCRAAINAGRSLGDEPVTISQLIRGACVISACQAIERTLGQSEPPVDELTTLQRLLQVEDAHPDLLICMRGERATSHALFDAIESGDVSVNGLADVKWSWPDNVLVWLWRMDTREDHALMLSLLSGRIAEMHLPMHEQIETERQFEQEVQNLPRNALLTRLLMPAMSKWGTSSRREHACLRCTTVALAAERYRRTHGAWPNKIDDLCPQYLDASPLDPFDGSPLRYRRLDDGVVIYSVAQDVIDNGGHLDRQQPNRPGVDAGVRLWVVGKRRQPPAPKHPEDDPPR